MTTQERYQGSLLGLAVGDALGTTLEFKAPGSFTPLTEMKGGGPFNLPPGYWTDDTSMALCLAESLLICEGFDPADQMNRYVDWWQNGHLSSTGECFDIGNTVRSSLARYLNDGDPYSGSSSPRSAGNGSLMRLAPIPLFFLGDPHLALQRAADSSRTTHAAPTCLDACRYYAGLIIGALQGIPKSDLLTPYFSPIADDWAARPLTDEIAEIAAGSFRQRQPPEIQGSGYVVKSLEAALWAFYHSESFAEGALLAVNLGDDADTTGAIYGQLAGAYYGKQEIPESWLETLAMRETIEDYATQLHKAARNQL
ncbi:ADP-ribosylglycohydrolase family protein [Synechococcus bigranulatus str. 'Rupite']|uniref:ADP-ribosylglycohydrolase family protein n=1 Tax=Thermostichus vulcanus str. 'Rupite' TaxID=2813851 RepID=A0ABT0CAM7_THEVL|nr:ADP-ribosylglycohydrolase family protein [Thermostichus vulcanus str. 'Rupite']